MFDASKNWALKCQPSYFSVNFFDIDGLINQYTIWCFVGKKYPIKTSHGQNKKKSTSGYIWISQTLYPQATGQWRIRRFNCILAAERPLRRSATPTIGHPGGCNIFLFKIGQKSYILPIKTKKLILTLEWYYRSLYCRSKAMIFKKWPIWRWYHLRVLYMHNQCVEWPSSKTHKFYYTVPCDLPQILHLESVRQAATRIPKKPLKICMCDLIATNFSQFLIVCHCR